MEAISFGVLIAVYARDDAKLFECALRSIYNNSTKPDEVVCVVDGPVPGVLENIILDFQREHGLKVVWLKKNNGLASALNVGLGHISHEWVVRADADDINLNDRFQKILACISRHPELDIVGSDILEVDKEGKPIAIKQAPRTQQEILKFAKGRNPFNHMSVAFRKSLVLSCGGYPNLYLKEDYALWCRLLSVGARALNIPEILVHATTGNDMYKRRGGIRYAKAEWGMQKELVACGLKSRISAIVDGIIRSCIFLSPSIVRKWIYLRFLRKSLQSTT